MTVLIAENSQNPHVIKDKIIEKGKKMKRKAFSQIILYSLALIFTHFLFVGCGAVLQSVEKDKQLGREVSKQVETDIGVHKHADLTGYIETVGDRLVRVNPDQRFYYSFAIVDQWEPNAFAAPGGYVYVSRGLLALTNNENELANVIGHEIMHVSQRHTAKQMAKTRLPGLLSLPGQVVGGVISENLGNLINAPVNALGGAYIAQHSRTDEFEADQLGQQLAARAGYDPQAMATFLDRLGQTAEIISGEKHRPGWFDTHPSTPDRVTRVSRDAQKIEWVRQPAVVGDKNAYLRQLDGLLLGVNPAFGVLHGRQLLHPVLELSIEFPPDWTTVVNRQAVVAIAPEKDGVLTIGIGGENIEPREAAKVFERALYEEYRIKPTRAEKVKIGAFPAHLLLYTDTSGKEPMHLAFLWVSYRNVLYLFIGLAPEHHRELLRAAALSFRPMTAKEKSSIKERRLKVVTARANESLSRLSKRTGNVWPLEATAVVNGLSAGQKLKKGQLVKIAVSQSFSGP
jgi:predicted Zn-dependent protease